MCPVHYLILKQPVSFGESKPGPPNHNLSRPGILGPECLKKKALSQCPKTIYFLARGLQVTHVLGGLMLSSKISQESPLNEK